MIILSLAACKQEYYPVIDRTMGALVVEGLVTNLKEPCKVKLTLTNAYDTALTNEGILGANVLIKDDAGNSYKMLEEPILKYYYSDPAAFATTVGRSYSLHIEMPGGDVYESAPQKLLEPATIDSIHGIITNKVYWYQDQLGTIISKNVYGAETFADIGYSSDSVFQFRFDNTLMKCYSFMYMYTPEMRIAKVPFPIGKSCPGAVCPYLMYCWKKFDLKTAVDLSSLTHNQAIKKIVNSPDCFFPFDTSYYPVVYVKDTCALDSLQRYGCSPLRIPGGPEGKVVETRLYALNQTAAVYYQELNKQLTAEGKLFDPIAVQLRGNVKCISNPSKVALGLFEVSACTTRSYWLWFNDAAGLILYHRIDDISPLPLTGSNKQMPDFWQLKYPW